MKKLINLFLSLLLILSAEVSTETKQKNTHTSTAYTEKLQIESSNFIITNQKIETKENVILTYQNLIGKTKGLQYKIKKKELETLTPLLFNTKNTSIYIKKLIANTSSNQGEAQDVYIKSTKFKINSKKIWLSPSKIELINNRIYCHKNTNKKNTQLNSKIINIYPEKGYLILRKNTLSLSFLPFKVLLPPIPYSWLNKDTNPLIPEVGYNKNKGYFINERLPIFTSKNSKTRLSFGYSEKLYTTSKLEHNINLSNNNFLDLNLGYNVKNNTNYLLKYTLKTQKKRKSNNLKNRLLNKQIITLYWMHENFINSELISYKPALSYELPNLQLQKTVSIKTYIFAGKITEKQDKNKLTDYTAHEIINLSKIIPLPPKKKLLLTLQHRLHFYKNHPNWEQIFFKPKMQTTYFLNPSLGLNIPIKNKNNSPFNFEKKYLPSNLEVTHSLEETFGPHSFKIEAFYDTQTKKLRDLHFQYTKQFHCLMLLINWYQEQKAFEFRFKFY